MKLAWGAKVGPLFCERLLQLCNKFRWTGDHASWLMACMAFETAETFSPSIKNLAGSGATGLIQFTVDTAIGLGTTVDNLARLTATKQLDYVDLYFQPYAHRIASLEDMYMAILAPVAIGKPKEAALYSAGKAYRMNAALDTNNDGIITKEEASRFVRVKLEKGFAYGYWREVNWTSGTTEVLALIKEIYAKLAQLETLVKK